MIKKILIGILILIGLCITFIFVFFYKPDLSKEDLKDKYISKASKFIKLPNGATMHYRDEGNSSGSVLVMIHGGLGSLQNWEGWVPYLKDSCRLISMDLLGHGLTGAYPENIYTRIAERDAVHMLLNKLEVTRYTVVGNSFGGGIALEIALEYPQEVERLILVDSEGIPNGENGYDASMFTNEKPVSPNKSEYTKLSWIERLGSKFIGPTIIKSSLESMIYNKELITDEFVDFYGRILRYKGNREAQILMFRQGMYLISSGNPMDLFPRLKEITCPTLIMAGEKDTLIPLRVEKMFNKNILNSELKLIKDAGHMPMIEKPKETAKIVEEFLD